MRTANDYDELIRRLKIAPQHPGTLWLSDKLGWSENCMKMLQLLRAWEGSIDMALLLAEALMPGKHICIHGVLNGGARSVGCNISCTPFPENFWASTPAVAILGALFTGLKLQAIEAAETDPAKRKYIKATV